MKTLRLFVGVLSFSLIALVGRADTQVFGATLSGLNESPPNDSPGTGWTVVTYDSITHQLRIMASFSGLKEGTTAAHIHAPAPPGMNAGVATTVPTFPGFPTGVTSGSYDGILDLTSPSSYNPSFLTNNGGTPAAAEVALTDAISDGQAYLNIHTTAHRGGEIRGNLARVPDESSTAMLLLPVALVLGVAGYKNSRRAAGRF